MTTTTPNPAELPEPLAPPDPPAVKDPPRSPNPPAVQDPPPVPPPPSGPEPAAAPALWEQSGERARAMGRRRMLVVTGGALEVAAFFALFNALDTTITGGNVQTTLHPSWGVAAVVLGLLGVGLFVAGQYQLEDAYADFLQAAQRNRIDDAVEELQHSMELPNLIRLNQRQIDAYHDLTKAQARRSHRNSQRAMGIGFLVLVAGSGVAINASDSTSKVVVGALASLGAAISGYVGATFMRAHNEALAQLNFYFRQPLVNSYLLTAERLAAKVEERAETQKAYSQMIERVMANAFTAPSARLGDAGPPAVHPAGAGGSGGDPPAAT